MASCGVLMAAYYPRPEASPGLARWRDRVFRRKSTSGASATGPESQRAGRAAESQSRRATERARARQASPPRPLQLRWQFQTHPQFRCPAAGALCLSPSLVAHSHSTYALGHSQWQKPPMWPKQVQPTRTRSRGRRPREIRPAKDATCSAEVWLASLSRLPLNRCVRAR